MLLPHLAAIWHRAQGHSAAAGSEGIDRGHPPSSCTSVGRLPPLGRSNDRSPPKSDAPISTALGAPILAISPGRCACLVLVLLSTTILRLGVCRSFIRSRGPVLPSGLSSLHSPSGYVGLSPAGYICGFRRREVVQYASLELLGRPWGRIIARPRPIATRQRKPYFRGCQKVVRRWL